MFSKIIFEYPDGFNLILLINSKTLLLYSFFVKYSELSLGITDFALLYVVFLNNDYAYDALFFVFSKFEFI